MNKKYFKEVFLVMAGVVMLFYLILFATSAHAEGGFSLGSNRVIYDGSKHDATVVVINSAKNAPFLAQSWVTEYAPDNQQPKMAPFFVTPPLYRQDEGKHTLRIIRTGGELPSDRESVFFLNVKSIPAIHDDLSGKSTLQFAYVFRVKLFYRPAELTEESFESANNLIFSRQGNTLVVRNLTPYYVTFNKVSVGGKEVYDVSSKMVPPLGDSHYSLPPDVKGNQVLYRIINDYGEAGPAQNATL
ncbi:molecular chaperone [Salmonella enterica]|nr:molecular chaperone [Salmonella enterica]ECK6621315.1 molecular chaperone [Salmonella enterica]EGL0138812.1 molecular chaperone [Salmonella enterica]